MGRKNNEDIAAEIIAMVPGSLSAAREGSNLAAVARHLIWPLVLFANSTHCPAPRRASLLEQLKEIIQKWSLVPATELAKLLESSAHPEDWYSDSSRSVRFFHN